MTAIQRGLKASGGDTAGPCISKYCISLDPKGTVFERPLAVLFVSSSFFFFFTHSRSDLRLFPTTEQASADCSVYTQLQAIRFLPQWRHQKLKNIYHENTWKIKSCLQESREVKEISSLGFFFP